ncbi:MAG: N-acetylmuramoyl-L-alanine amidase [Bacteroidota bacterium]|nr:N-acetylmuramoyl-L-alanine amidase [Bacteroidota bacterium]
MYKWLFIFCFFAQTLVAQSIKQCKQRFDTYLNFRGSLNNLVTFEADAIYISDSKGKKEFAVYKHELDMLAEFFENNSFKQQEQLLKLKGTKKYTHRQRDSLYIYIDDTKKVTKLKKQKPLQGYRVAIDPGHFSTNLTDAQIEQKYLYFVKDSIKNPLDTIKLFESALTFNTAQLLKAMLEEQGATVFLTRNQNNFTSFNCTYNTWLKLHKQRMLDSLKTNDLLSVDRYNKLIKLGDYKLFWEFFRDFDLTNRAKIINQFNPHATLIIHYNVDEKNAPWAKPSNKNFTMTFIGGAFTESNFDKPETKIHFLRLLLTKQLNQSEKLAAQTVLNFNKNLGIEMAGQFDADYLKDNCLPTESKGVFARNLILCRLINSPLVYGEALYQDNKTECEALMKLDKTVGNVKTNERIYNTAKSYYDAVFGFLKTL